MKMQTTPRVEPTFGDDPLSSASAPAPAGADPAEAVFTAWPEVGEAHTEPHMAPPAGAAPDASVPDPFAADPDPLKADAPARKPLPLKTMALGGTLAAGLIGAIVWIGNTAQEQRHQPPALAAPAGMSTKALPAPDVQKIAPPPVVQSALVAPSEPQHAVPVPPVPPGATAANSAAPAGTSASGTIAAAPPASRAVAALQLQPAEAAPAKLKTAARTGARTGLPQAAVKKAKKTAGKPAKAGAVREPRKQAAPAKPARKTAVAAKPRCDAANRATARCRAISKAAKK